jgi:cell pole-organizing protein PopZ
VAACLVATAARAQQQPAKPVPEPQAPADRQATPAEVQALFDAMVVVQAQKALALSDAQYPQFVGRLKTLQDMRRQHQRERNQLIQQMQRLSAPRNAAVDEAQLRALLKSFDDLQARAAADLRRAYENLDQVLDVRQQVRFRVFEDQIERRKFDFLLNARRRARTQVGPGRDRPPY